MISVATMLARLEGLLGTADLSEWEQGFVRSVGAKVRQAEAFRRSYPDARPGTTTLSSAQVEKIAELHDRHFG